MKRKVVVERAAEDDLFENTEYIRQDRPSAASEFVTTARATFEQLAEHPEIGRRYQTTHPRLQHLRIWRIRRFEDYLIFYRMTKDTVFVEPVLYGGRDLGRILEGD